jgi:2',3'-cyclic-nucleotide 2'-phosphodiesterase (5'-nucleotidase family)
MKIQHVLFIVLISTTISCQKKIFQVANIKSQRNDIGKTKIDEDKDVEKIILPYRTKLNETMNVVIADVKGILTKGSPSSSLTNFCADAVFDAYNKDAKEPLDVVVLNSGGIRSNSLGKGELLVGEIYEIMPFDNMLTVITMDNLQLKEFFDRIAKSKGWPISKGSGFEIKGEMAQAILVNGEPLAASRKYRVGMPDYIANGGDGTANLGSLPRFESGVFIRDLMIQYCKDKKIIEVNNENRIY